MINRITISAKPFCSSCITPVMSSFSLKRKSSNPQNSLYVAGANVIPRYERGSLGSDVELFGIGVITPFDHKDGTFPVV